MSLRPFNPEKDRSVFADKRLFKFMGDRFERVTKFQEFLEAFQNPDLFFVFDLGGPGSGHYGHKGTKGRRGGSAPGTSAIGVARRAEKISQQPGKKGDSIPSWDVHVKNLNEEFGDWNEKKSAALRQELTEGMSQAVSGSIRQHLKAEHKDFSETFKTENIENLGEALSTGDINNELARIERATQWDLYHRTGGQETVKLYHGSSFGDGEVPEWTSSVKSNFSMTESYDQAYSFASWETGTVLELEIPISQIKMSWRTIDFGPGYKEYEYIIKAGDYSKGAKSYSVDNFKAYFDSSIRMNKSKITEKRL